MVIKKDNIKNYTIKEVSELSGLSESTLRYYETIGLIEPIGRDSSSKHRVYSEDNLNLITAVSCLNATGMSIEDIRTYFNNRNSGKKGALDQIALLQNQGQRLEKESHLIKLRRKYVAIKIEYWNAIVSGDKKRALLLVESSRKIAKELKLPKEE